VTRRPVSESLGCHVKGVAPPHPCHDEPLNYAGAAFKRVGAYMPERPKSLYEELEEFTTALLKKWERKYGFRRLTSEDYSVEQWLDEINAPGSRKRQLYEISKKNYSPNKHTVVKMFIKDEFYDEYKYPRLIMSRHDRFKCRVGPMFHRIEKILFSLPMFIKKIPVSERGEYIRKYLWKPNSKYFATDFSAYESHFTPEMMRAIEFVLYRHMAPNDSEGRQFLSDIEVLCGRNRCVNKLASVWINGVRMSGEMNTSLGNSFANYVLIKFAAKRAGVKVKGVVEGDDACFRCDGHISPGVFEAMGLSVKFVEYPTIGEMSFCGILQDEDGRQTVTDPYKVLCRFGWSKRKYVGCSDKTKQALAIAKALSYIHAYPHMPIVRPFCDMILRTCKMSKFRVLRVINNMDSYHRDLYLAAFNARDSLPGFEPRIETRQLIDKLYGISPAKQIELEAKFVDTNIYGPIELNLDFPDVYTMNFDLFATRANGFSRYILHRPSMERVQELVKAQAQVRT
jgi:hypothetical protein